MCSTIAPNCEGVGGTPFAEIGSYASTERGPGFRPTTSQYSLSSTVNPYTLNVDAEGRRQYGHYGRNRQRNRSDLWAAASRELVTESPNWNPINIGRSGQFPASTDAGEIKQFENHFWHPPFYSWVKKIMFIKLILI